MSVYQAAPSGKNVPQVVPGFPLYLLGSYAADTSDTVMSVSTVALSGSTATVAGTVTSGQIPVAGQLVTITGAAPSYFNVSNATILSVSSAATPDVGVYSITFSLTNTNIGTTNSPGSAVMPPPEVGDSITLGGNTAWKSQACGIQAIQGSTGQSGLRASVRFPTALAGTCSVILQAADVNMESAFVDVGSAIVSASTAGNATMYAGTNAIVASFVRFRISGITAAGSGKIIGTILII